VVCVVAVLLAVAVVVPLDRFLRGCQGDSIRP